MVEVKGHFQRDAGLLGAVKFLTPLELSGWKEGGYVSEYKLAFLEMA